ncbi:UDP-N-acetylglucosamine 4,6-dehydratase [Helicobacter monodelphidis]|uniref:polysaccharide biosynthesis protein n=1 Tax=Helicobacter sp. 15-1451 TaxID=2004995 RepID=UPI000DCE6D8A|nr:nucleoside-diphosphate sugar epimerase/dehydratase [Helicobacter sp. 15-1451]RAX58927.1 UDP-N-acetylglucosamine 4,6-dehydratase [Helicobacter sp. 15-1451]
MKRVFYSRFLVRLLRPSNFKRTTFFVFADILFSYFTLTFAYNLRYSFEVPLEFTDEVKISFLLLIFCKIIAIFLFKIYLVPWRFFGLSEALKIFYAHSVAYSICALLFYILGLLDHIPLSVIIMDFVISSITLGCMRISKRIYIENVPRQSPRPTLIFGGGTQAANIIKSALSREIPHYPLAIIDYRKASWGTYIGNLKIHPFSECQNLIEKHKITSAILTKEFAKPPLEDIFQKLDALGILDIKIATTLSEESNADSHSKAPLKDISIEDLLSRPIKDLDKDLISQFIADKVVLITGGGGSIGSEIARQCKIFGAKKLILLDHSEYNLYAIMEEIGEQGLPVMMSILEKERLQEVLNTYKPDILLHAAAYKHVPLCEANILSAIENNILGSKNVIDCAIQAEIPKIVIISTDKAVRPTNVMGATKRTVELYAQNIDSKKSEVVAVRFGNVLGSSGSVVPKFKAQIESGGPITVTHPDITRYFMLIPEACRLVLQAASIAEGGEIFILDMGSPVKIVDLAKNMLKLYRKENEVEIIFSGLRPGEKLYEELLIDDSEAKTQYDSIHVARPTPYSIQLLEQKIQELLTCKDKIAKLKEIVVEFNHQENKEGKPNV